jgi:hypothetical protein
MQQPSLSRRAPRFGFVVALIALGLAALGVTAAGAAGSNATPLRADVAATVAATGPTTFQLSGAGDATHLGKFQYAGTVEITDVDTHGVITDVLIETLTAANGDTLTLHCDQTARPVAPGVYHGTDQWTVIGGTGRFAGATGSGTGSTDVDLNQGTASKTMSGPIALN